MLEMQFRFFFPFARGRERTQVTALGRRAFSVIPSSAKL